MYAGCMTLSGPPLKQRANAMWRSYRTLPVWVQIWVAVILVPVNAASVLFWGQPGGFWVMLLSLGAVLCNAPVLWVERGFTRTMALSHLLPWSVLVLWLVFAPPEGSLSYQRYLTLLLVVNAISLVFDFRDAYLWRQERAVRKSQQI